MASTVGFSGRNLPPPQSPFVDPGSGVLDFTGYQFLLNLLNQATSSLATANVNTGLVGAGTNQATALQLNADWNEFDSVPSGSGALLSALQQGQTQIVFNDATANAILVYPPPGGTINQLATNQAFSVAANSKATFYFVEALEIKT